MKPWSICGLCALTFGFIACGRASGTAELPGDDDDATEASATRGDTDGGVSITGDANDDADPDDDDGPGDDADPNDDDDDNDPDDDDDVDLPPVWGFIASPTGDAVGVFDAANHEPGPILDLLPDADYPYELSITPDGNEVWTVGAQSDGVAIMDARSPAILHQAQLLTGDYPVNIVFDDSRAYISNAFDASLTVLDRTTYMRIDTIDTPGGRRAGKANRNPCTGHIYVTQWMGPRIMAYDVGADAWTFFDLGDTSALWDVVVEPSGERAFAIDQGTNQLHVFGVGSTGGALMGGPAQSLDVCEEPWGLDLTSNGEKLVVACQAGDAVHIVDLATMNQTAIPLPSEAEARSLAIDATDVLAYVSTGTVPGGEGLFVVDLATATLREDKLVLGLKNPSLVVLTPQQSLCLGR